MTGNVFFLFGENEVVHAYMKTVLDGRQGVLVRVSRTNAGSFLDVLEMGKHLTPVTMVPVLLPEEGKKVAHTKVINKYVFPLFRGLIKYPTPLRGRNKE